MLSFPKPRANQNAMKMHLKPQSGFQYAAPPSQMIATKLVNISEQSLMAAPTFTLQEIRNASA